MHSSRILQIQDELKKRKAFAIIFFSGDPHISEYAAERWKVREWVSGFYGSAGTVVVSRVGTALWTDSRYFLEAEHALKGSGIALMRDGLPATPTIESWLLSEFAAWAHSPGKSSEASSGVNAEARVLLNSDSSSLKQFNELKAGLKAMVLEPVSDFLDDIWKDRPALPSAKIYEISSTHTGESREERLFRLKGALSGMKVSAFLISALDEIAWLLNLRGSDVRYNPVFYAYLLISNEETVLCTHYADMQPSLRRALEKAGLRLAAYEDIKTVLEAHRENLGADPATLNLEIAHIDNAEFKLLPSPLKLWKARKNTAELNSSRQVMEKDGIAMVSFLHWLEEALEKGEELSELKISEYIDRFRGEQEGHIGSSFTSIVGFQEHAAIIHYSVDEKSNKPIEGEGLLLIDSGGQYEGGTTDITRTVLVGSVPENFQQEYTMVLKGHIQLARAVFPRGTTGVQLDCLARISLWEHGLNYGHGTGHGVGFALNVHEGPQNISPTTVPVALEAGMICSNEPGYYKDASHGMRIENLLAVLPHPEHKNFLHFETLSLCPLEIDLIQHDMLSNEEIDWINDYHRTVWERLSPSLSDPLKNWLSHKTRTLSKTRKPQK